MSTYRPSSEYSEAEIVSAITDIYRILIRLGHLQPDDVVFPPSEGHVLDLSQLGDESRIDVRILSLMRHLPIPAAGCDSPIAPAVKGIRYTDPRALAESRDIDGYWRRRRGIGSVDATNALPTVLPLTARIHPDGAVWVLDIADSRSPISGDTLKMANSC